MERYARNIVYKHYGDRANERRPFMSFDSLAEAAALVSRHSHDPYTYTLFDVENPTVTHEELLRVGRALPVAR